MESDAIMVATVLDELEATTGAMEVTSDTGAKLITAVTNNDILLRLFPNFRKRSADAEPESDAEPDADPSRLYG